MSDHRQNSFPHLRLHASDDAPPEQGDSIGKLPPEVGALLVVAGVIGIVLPGPGTPVFLAGASVLWPSVFGRVERFAKWRFPKTHRASIVQLKQYLNDLDYRFPGSLERHTPDGGSAGTVPN